MKYNIKHIIIGKPNKENKPSLKYRINIQQRCTQKHNVQNMKSFMIYDYDGKSTIEKIKNKLVSVFKK